MSVTSSNVTATRRPGSGKALTEKILRSTSSSPYSTSPRSISVSSSTTRCSISRVASPVPGSTSAKRLPISLAFGRPIVSSLAAFAY